MNAKKSINKIISRTGLAFPNCVGFLGFDGCCCGCCRRGWDFVWDQETVFWDAAVTGTVWAESNSFVVVVVFVVVSVAAIVVEDNVDLSFAFVESLVMFASLVVMVK